MRFVSIRRHNSPDSRFVKPPDKIQKWLRKQAWVWLRAAILKVRPLPLFFLGAISIFKQELQDNHHHLLALLPLQKKTFCASEYIREAGSQLP